MASIKERYTLCEPDSGKSTMHLVLDLAGSGINYTVGDSIAVLPSNNPGIVEKILQFLKATGEEFVKDKKSQEAFPLRDYLKNKVTVTDFSRKFLQEIVQRQTNEEKRHELEFVLESGCADRLKQFQHDHEVWDLLQQHEEVTFTPQQLCDLLKPLLPRFYSIASSKSAVGDETHLTVAMLEYDTGEIRRMGVCTNFLCYSTPLNQSVVPVYLHPHKGFTLPEDHSTSIIMVGPGTGIAPFRAFMQERESLKAPGRNWLFFGEWKKDFHFYYEKYWSSLNEKGVLRLDVAFSRDQEEKMYVQHRMIEKGADLYQWLKEGAHFYVCGDASCMAKDVDQALHQIVQKHGGMSEKETREYVKSLRKEKRYLRDVY